MTSDFRQKLSQQLNSDIVLIDDIYAIPYGHYQQTTKTKYSIRYTINSINSITTINSINSIQSIYKMAFYRLYKLYKLSCLLLTELYKSDYKLIKSKVNGVLRS